MFNINFADDWIRTADLCQLNHNICLEAINRKIKRRKRALWPYLAKFCHFGKSLQVFGKFLAAYFSFGKMLSLLWQICDIIGLSFNVAYSQIMENILIIWSHWKRERREADNSRLELYLQPIQSLTLLGLLILLSSSPPLSFSICETSGQKKIHKKQNNGKGKNNNNNNLYKMNRKLFYLFHFLARSFWPVVWQCDQIVLWATF